MHNSAGCLGVLSTRVALLFDYGYLYNNVIKVVCVDCCLALFMGG